ncbi:hypothetical protein H6G94_33575 [Nostoc punctiforme FACHB-252]|uniref:Uncharacterized protein n=1 Tax=Nostoc punctiforme FACHB-252 TaxID=1357509 RepID=A0ABR8HKS7_NOSPU|nr:hypothetical protein [Nostoc punctiforme]MBD2616118.1 hypothetical protein [Nostoc punctiforme FACHB-252]
MINFSELQLVINEKYSFVGIDKRDSQLRLCLPKGLNLRLFNTFNSKRDLFFLLYKILRQFKDICIQKKYLPTAVDRDGVIQSSGSIQTICLPDAGDEEGNIFYSKLDAVSTILSLYEEPKILSLAYRLGLSEKIDYSKIHYFLHQAVYLNNGAAYIDVMTLPRQQVQYLSTDIVAMYCYILWEIKQQLNEEISSELQILAEDFKHRYIGAEYSLFHEEYCSLTVDILKDTLELIEHNTPFKDVDYWQLHDAIELFLYGQLSQQDEGEIWGIKNFHSVWESMCLTYLVKNVDSEHILHLDTTYLADNVVMQANSKPKIINLAGVFTINNRKLIPDAVIYSNPFTKMPVIEDFKLQKHEHDDFSYRTSFCSDLDYFKRYFLGKNRTNLRIAHEGQCRDRKHTFTELEKFYDRQDSTLIINSQLPNNFYSYWKIDLNKLDKEVLGLMERLNHIFYVALKSGVYTAKRFYEFLVDKFDAKNINNTGNYNPVKDSLLREYSINTLEESEQSHNPEREIVLTFEMFLQVTSSYLKIIDIKYLDLDYFFDETNLRKLKERSIRKQFVYEYLLQKHIEKNSNFNNLEIKSSFWLPSWQKRYQDINIDSEYLDGYINLERRNFKTIVDSYLA